MPKEGKNVGRNKNSIVQRLAKESADSDSSFMASDGFHCSWIDCASGNAGWSERPHSKIWIWEVIKKITGKAIWLG